MKPDAPEQAVAADPDGPPPSLAQTPPEIGPAMEEVLHALHDDHVVLLAVFTAERPPSARALDALGRLHASVREGDVTVLTMTGGHVEKTFAPEVVEDPQLDENLLLAGAAPPSAIPLLVIIDRGGVVRYSHVNVRDADADLDPIKHEIAALAPSPQLQAPRSSSTSPWR